MSRKLAVVLFNLGGPDGPAAVRPFLFNLFRDPAIIGAPAAIRYPLAALISGLRARSARANYAVMGGGSPLLPETRKQADALAARLAERSPELETRVFIAMRYWDPLTEDVARAVEAFGPDEVVLLPLYPQFSSTTTASSLKAWARAFGAVAPRTVCCYPDHAGLAAAHALKIEQAWEAAGRREPVRLLFSAHGVPEKVIEAGDPYQAQIEASVAAVVAQLSRKWDWRICYQSRVGPMKWLGPSTPEAIEEAASDGLGVVVTPIAFVSEHIETLVELDHEYGELAETLGCPSYVRAPALGVEPLFIDALADLVQNALAGRPELRPGGPWRCAPQSGQCPFRDRGGAA
jgi:protoporphyrin/coproporphyrin ferrochelatase